MKKLLILLFCFVFIAGCSQVEPPDDGEVAAAYQSALEVMFWFTFDGMPYGSEGYQEIDAMRYDKVTHPEIQTMTALREHLENIFIVSFVDDLLADGKFRDIDGSLYVMGAARGANIFKGDETYEIIRESDTKIIYRVTVEDLHLPETGDPIVIDYTTHDMVYESIGGKWVFSHFEMVR
ncbi:MAG: hypothetical protein FWG94_02370 [Oscillospiraceae bacterium]|nr:hypothetical protein [Oscillospiraceae bacterium]